MRQRYLELDDRTDDIRDAIAASGVDMDAFLITYDTSWIYHENGLEGVVLTYPEIRSAIDNKIISDVSLLPTYRVIKAQKACIDTMRDKAKAKRFAVSIAFLKELHGMLVDDPDHTGIYRKDIPIHRTYFHEIAQPQRIESEFEDVLTYLRDKHERDTHPIELAANVHHRFMRVFPFAVHSGVIGRLLLNYVLMRADYLPAVIHASDRQRYYEALRGSEREFRVFVCEAMENAIDNTMRYVAAHAGSSMGRRIAQ